MADDDKLHWTSYWSADRVAACFEGEDSNYEASIQGEWKHFFGELPEGSRVLDIGTGNGAIALIAGSLSRELGRAFEVTGVDAADIDPARFLRGRGQELADISFRGSVDAAHMPFQDGQFDALCSQYSLEYMDRTAVLRELRRVAAPGARLQCVVHASPGVADLAAADELEDCAYVCDELAVIDKARRTITLVAQLERGELPVTEDSDRKARKLINSFETALGRLGKRRDAGRDTPLVRNVLEILIRSHQQRRLFSLEQLQDNLDRLAGEVDAHAARLRELRQAACSRDELAELASEVGAAGFDQPATRALLRVGDGGQLGWLLTARRAEQG